jgi:C4-dicarboxylate-specific signal transduction histidine kinase
LIVRRTSFWGSRAVPESRTLIHLDDIARQVLGLVEQDLLLNQISVATQFKNDLPEVYADRTQIQLVILNLVKDAIDAMKSTPTRARHLRIFEPFFTTKPTGMGLGLPICQTIIQNYGGSLRLAKTDAGGSTFEIALQIAASNLGSPGNQS